MNKKRSNHCICAFSFRNLPLPTSLLVKEVRHHGFISSLKKRCEHDLAKNERTLGTKNVATRQTVQKREEIDLFWPLKKRGVMFLAKMLGV